jgi:hypothetical protein
VLVHPQDNDRLHLKCLKTRKNIQRLRLERAYVSRVDARKQRNSISLYSILYERLSTIPAAENALFSRESGIIAGAPSHPQPHPVQAQEHLGHPIFSPEMQARIQAEKEQLQLEAVHHGHPHYLRVQVPSQVEAPRGAPQLLPARHYAQHPGDSSPIVYPQPSVPMQVDQPPGPAVNSSYRKFAPGVQSDTNQAAQPQPQPPSTYQEVRNGGSRTYPFVLEYPHPPFAETDLGPPSYPSEIRFHQYDASDRPVHRNRRDFDREGEKSNRLKRRPHEPDREHEPLHPDPRPRSPRVTSSTSSHGGYAYPLQHPFLPSERDTQPRHMPEGDRDPQRHAPVPSHDTRMHPEELRRYEADRESFGTGNGNPCHQAYDYESGPQRERGQDPVRHLPPTKKRSYSQSGKEHVDGDYDRYAREREGRDERKSGHRGQSRAVEESDERYTLPRVREGEVMD